MKVHRLARFLSKVLLTRKHRLTVPYSRKYVIASELDPAKSGNKLNDKAPPFGLFEMAEDINFDDGQFDYWEERLLFEITGERLDLDKFNDETSDDQDPDDDIQEANPPHSELLLSPVALNDSRTHSSASQI